MASGDRNVFVIDGIAGADFRTFGVKGNCQWTAFLFLFRCARVIDNALMVLPMSSCVDTIGLPHNFHD
jgi:hypothetical protein